MCKAEASFHLAFKDERSIQLERDLGRKHGEATRTSAVFAGFEWFGSLKFQPAGYQGFGRRFIAEASFYIAYVVTSWTSLSKELTRVIALLGDWIGGCSGCFDNELQAPSMTYHSEIPRILLFLLIGLIYFLLSPLILPFILIFFCIGYIIYRNQLLNVYLPKYETGGQFWPIVHNSTIFSLVLMQAMAFGIFSLKKLPLASSLLLPLPVVTLLFHGYCRKRFEPVFQTFSAETLIKKDRSEQNDPGMNEFFDKLKTAYNDPSLAPKDRSQYADDQNTPLLFSLES